MKYWNGHHPPWPVRYMPEYRVTPVFVQHIFLMPRCHSVLGNRYGTSSQTNIYICENVKKKKRKKKRRVEEKKWVRCSVRSTEPCVWEVRCGISTFNRNFSKQRIAEKTVRRKNERNYVCSAEKHEFIMENAAWHGPCAVMSAHNKNLLTAAVLATNLCHYSPTKRGFSTQFSEIFAISHTLTHTPSHSYLLRKVWQKYAYVFLPFGRLDRFSCSIIHLDALEKRFNTRIYCQSSRPNALRRLSICEANR